MKENNHQNKETQTYRLNKYLALTNIASSRRNADELISKGFISVDGKIVTDFSFRVNPSIHSVLYKGKPIDFKEEYHYVLLNKPKDTITTRNDEKDRKTVYECLKYSFTHKLKPVGRLDRNTTGLLLLTNDGDLINKLTHPSNEIIKIYQATLDKQITKNDIDNFTKGAVLEDGKFIPDEIALLEDLNTVGIQIHSGKNRIVRRFFEHFGFNVKSLDRVFFAGLTKYKLPRGKSRELTPKELRFMNSQLKQNNSK